MRQDLLKEMINELGFEAKKFSFEDFSLIVKGDSVSFNRQRSLKVKNIRIPSRDWKNLVEA